MKTATSFFERAHDNTIRCLACNHYCLIASAKTGLCGVRKNENGKLKLLVENLAVGLHLDPIEKKPLFHFLPGQTALSFGTLGCNFSCAFCQNWEQSQIIKTSTKNLITEFSREISPEEIVNLALKMKTPAIAYTYNEPTVFVEYALKTMILAKKNGLKNVWVSNGFISKETRSTILPYLDAINIDLKSFSEDFYQKVCGGKLKPVLENIKWFWKNKVWTEITSLLIPGQNDSEKELTQTAIFLKTVSKNIPWHLSAFTPNYKMIDTPPTPLVTLLKAYEIGKKEGLNFIYVGNVSTHYQFFSTFCPHCNELLLRRPNHIDTEITENFKNSKCLNCGEKIAGVWK